MIPDELRHAFPEPDERFQACVRRTLDALAQEDAQKERLPMKRTHLRVGVLIAVAVLLLSTIGVAAASLRYGVFDFLRGADGSPAGAARGLGPRADGGAADRGSAGRRPGRGDRLLPARGGL